jgi:protein TonB
MDVKKSKNASLEDKKLTYLLLGLVVALGLCYIALEWTQSEVVKYEVVDEELAFEEEIEIVQTQQEQQVTPPPPPPEQKIEELVLDIVDNDTETETVEINTEDDQSQKIEIAPPVAAPEPEEEEEETVFMVVEEMPAFPGGDAELFKFLSKNIRYPAIAQESGIQGRVICQFTVNRDGSIVDVRAVRSSGDASLDKEAIRVIQSMPKWKPGKQRGKAVRVNYTVPVTFRLQ